MAPRNIYPEVAGRPPRAARAALRFATSLTILVLVLSTAFSSIAPAAWGAPRGLLTEASPGNGASDPEPAGQPVTSYPPLPADCAGLAPPGGDPPAACVYGYVLLDGAPVTGASVQILGESGSLAVTTESGPASPEPYYAAVLSEPPLGVSAEELLEVEATADGQTNATTFSAIADGQQVDVWLSSTCGPTPVAGGPMGSDTTWTRECGPYIVTGNLLVLSGVTLTVEAGTVVKFDAGRALQLDGDLVANGTRQAMIVFTSNAGGLPGDWGYLLLTTGSTASSLQHALIEYAGGAEVSDNGALRINGVPVSLSSIVVRHSASDGIHLFNAGVAELSHLTVQDNGGDGIYVDNSGSLNVTNSTIRGNGRNGLYILSEGTVWVADSVMGENGIRGIQSLYGSHHDLTVSNCLIHGNRGGIWFRSSGTLSVSDSCIADNAGASQGTGIYFSDGTILVQQSVITGNVASQDGGGLRLQGVVQGIHHNVISDNSAGTDGGGLEVTGWRAEAIHHNIITGNSAGRYGGGVRIYGGQLHHVYNNIIVGNRAGSDGGGLSYAGGSEPSTIANNTFLDNTASGRGAAVSISRDIAITQNTILHNMAGLGQGGIHATDNPDMSHNNLYGNSDYDLYNGTPQGTGELNAEENWWGTTSYAEIAAQIWDWYDDPGVDLVDFEPWLASHDLAAPISPPTDLVAVSNSTAITLTWSPNPEADLAGYKVYYDVDGEGYPYDGAGAFEGDSPVDVGDVTSATLTGLAPGTYYLSVTAYDTATDGTDDQTDGNESWFAYEVTAPVAGAEPQASFYGSPTSGVAPLEVSFTNQSTGDYDTCDWTFGDGGSSAECADPSHTYTLADTYTVTLSVSGPGGSDTLTRPNYISVSAPAEEPVADFSGSPTTGVAPLEVSFTNYSTGDYDTCEWNFGDGGSSGECHDPTHTYTSVGTYPVTLTVSGPGGGDSLTRLGYVTTYAGDGLWYSGGPYGGQVNGLAMAPSQPDLLYAASELGVYKTSDAGATWTRTGFPATAATAVQVSAGDPDTVYAGTADGVYRTVNGGDTWWPRGLSGARVNALAVDPRNDQVVYAGAGLPRQSSAGEIKGVFKSTDGGASWDHTTSWGDAVMCLLIDADDPDMVYAGITTMGTEDGLLKSPDGGETWDSRHVAPDDWNDEDLFALAMTPGGAAPATLYAFSISAYEDVYRSTDQGESWTPTGTDWWMPDYPAALAVDPANPDLVYVGVTDWWGQFYQSPDGGGTWSEKAAGLPEGGPTSIVIDPRNQHVYVGLETGGIYKSTDLAESWHASSEGFNNGYVRGLALDPTDSSAGFATLDGRGHYLAQTNDAGHNWTYLASTPSKPGYLETTPAELGAVAYAPQNPAIVYVGDGWASTDELYVYKSIDGGQTWSPKKLLDLGTDIASLGVSDIWFSPASSSIVLVAVAGFGSDGGGIYRTTSGGLDWHKELSTWATALASDPNYPQVVYAGSARCGYVYRSTNSGDTWVNISPSMPPGECWVEYVRDVAVGSDSRPYAATSGGLMQWDGETWTELAGLPTGNLSALAIDRFSSPEGLYIGTMQDGVYLSQDAGATWAPFNEGLGCLAIRRLVLGERSPRLLSAGTAYGGAWFRVLATPEYRIYLPLVVRQ